MLSLLLTGVEDDDVVVTGLTLRADGSGDDSAGIATVELVEDLDGDGLRGEEDPVLGSGAYGEDDGTVTFELEEPAELSFGMRRVLLVTYRFASQGGCAIVGRVARRSLPWLLAAAGLALALASRWRRGLTLWLVAAILAAGLSCGGSGSGGTFRATVVAVEARAGDAPVPATGLPVSGPLVSRD